MRDRPRKTFGSVLDDAWNSMFSQDEETLEKPQPFGQHAGRSGRSFERQYYEEPIEKSEQTNRKKSVRFGPKEKDQYHIIPRTRRSKKVPTTIAIKNNTRVMKNRFMAEDYKELPDNVSRLSKANEYYSNSTRSKSSSNGGAVKSIARKEDRNPSNVLPRARSSTHKRGRSHTQVSSTTRMRMKAAHQAHRSCSPYKTSNDALRRTSHHGRGSSPSRGHSYNYIDESYNVPAHISRDAGTRLEANTTPRSPRRASV